MFEAGDAGADPKVRAKLLRDLVELGLDVGASGEHRFGVAVTAAEVGERRAGRVELLLGVVLQVGQVGEFATGGFELVLVASAS